MWRKTLALIAAVIPGASFSFALADQLTGPTNSAPAQMRVVSSDATAQFVPLGDVSVSERGPPHHAGRHTPSLALHVGVAVDVSLGGLDRPVTGQQLNVAQ